MARYMGVPPPDHPALVSGRIRPPMQDPRYTVENQLKAMRDTSKKVQDNLHLYVQGTPTASGRQDAP